MAYFINIYTKREKFRVPGQMDFAFESVLFEMSRGIWGCLPLTFGFVSTVIELQMRRVAHLFACLFGYYTSTGLTKTGQAN